MFGSSCSRRNSALYTPTIFCGVTLSADQGHTIVGYLLAVCYNNGEQEEQDFFRAARLYNLAADEGYLEAHNGLAIRYLRGVKRDTIQREK